MSICPININNGFDNILFKTGLLNKDSPTLGCDRKRLFENICIPVRLFIVIFILYLSLKKYHIFLALSLFLFSLLTFIHLYTKNNYGCQWWSNIFETLLALIATIICFICLIKGENASIYVGILFLISTFAGYLQSINNKPFE